ncbi:MAG: apolipoprotein N-acyltransferase, partial [Acinetobacter sp.]|nr:apolipoprotein N-acyltransferase [Acinetobacter sp.]
MSRNIHYSSPSKKTNQAKIPLVWSLLIALLAGGVFSFALAPYHYWWLALLSPAVLYACVHQRSAKQAAWIGLAYGFGLWFVGAFWLYTSIHLFGAISSPVAVLMVAVMAFVMALFSAAQLYVYRRFFPETPLAFAPVWVVFEWLKTWLFTGFPWLFVGYAFTERFLDHVAPIFGVLGVSFIAVLLACAGAELLRKRWVWLVPSAVVLLSTWAVGQITWVQQKNTAPLSVSLVQGNIQQDLKWQQQQFFKTLQTYTQLSEQEWGRDLVVWPESAVPSLQTSIPEFFDDVGRVAQASS